MPFNADNISGPLSKHHNRVIAYLTKNKLAQIIYNPLLAGSFDYLFQAQQEEFARLYGRLPDFYNGHHHMHLCANMLLGKLLPKGARVRRTFTFDQGEKNPFNLFYRHILDNFVSRKFISTNSFFSILPVRDYERLQKIFKRASMDTVEIEVHPENKEEIEFLLSDPYRLLIDSVHMGSFHQINNRI